MTSIDWSDKYPPKSELRREVRATVEAIRAVLLEEIGESRIRGIYGKGSANRAWDTLIDYVPEVSDVDIHVWLADDSAVELVQTNLDLAFAIQAGLERKYAESISAPLHYPRPQIMLLNLLARDPLYVPSPPRVIEVLYGEPYPAHEDKPVEEIVRIDVEQLQADFETLADFPLHTLDKPGKYLWSVVRNLVWRVSPTGPRVLDILGMDPDRSWGMNRSGVVLALREIGQERLAAKWVEYYLAAWDYYLSGFQDSAAARRAIRAGADVIALGYAACMAAR